MLAYTHYENDPRVIRAAEAALEGKFSVDVIALRREGQLSVETIRGVRVFRVQERYRGSSRLKYLQEYVRFFVRCAMMSARLFITRRYKVIHVHNMPDALVFAALVPKLFGAKVILDIHDPMPETYGSKFPNLAHSAVGRLLLLQEKLSVAFADATITVSEPLKQGVLIKHGYLPETIGVIANFTDDELFKVMACPPVEDRIRFVFHGTILERYGLQTLLNAVAQVRRRDKIQVRIIGEGDFSATLKDLIGEYGVGNTVTFDNHAYPVHEIPKMLSDCHVGVVPLDIGTSTVANFALPLKLVEYTCLGMPSIAVRSAAIEHYFCPDECMFFDSGDVQALARLIDSVVENPDCLIEYRRKLEGVRERLLWSKEKKKYIAMLRDLAGYSVGSAG
jgi:glycosyltransferase involved in cell wall biosynthesis